MRGGRSALAWTCRQHRLAALLVGLLSGAPGPACASEKPLSLHAVLDSLRIACGVPAMAAAVVYQGRVIASGRAGVRVAFGKDALKAGDPFHIGSCTKSMTAYMVARLVEQGHLRWSTTVGEAFPELRSLMRPEYAGVGLDQLLCHRGGIPPYTELADDTLLALNRAASDPVSVRRAFVARVLQEPPVHEPGAVYTYSNAGYTVAAAMAERAAGRSWEELMQRQVFDPLKMKSAGFGWPAVPRGPRTTFGHWCDTTGAVHSVGRDHPYRLGAVLAPGGDVHADIADLARWMQFNLDGPAHRPKGDAITDSTWHRLHSDPDGVTHGYAMGWQVIAVSDSETALLHDGTAGTFYTRMVIFPMRDRAVVIAANAGAPCGERACEDGLGVVMAEVRGRLGPIR
jgi:CubicO group peptidase (beta-lactamase class C family)